MLVRVHYWQNEGRERMRKKIVKIEGHYLDFLFEDDRYPDSYGVAPQDEKFNYCIVEGCGILIYREEDKAAVEKFKGKPGYKVGFATCKELREKGLESSIVNPSSRLLNGGKRFHRPVCLIVSGKAMFEAFKNAFIESAKKKGIDLNKSLPYAITSLQKFKFKEANNHKKIKIGKDLLRELIPNFKRKDTGKKHSLLVVIKEEAILLLNIADRAIAKKLGEVVECGASQLISSGIKNSPEIFFERITPRMQCYSTLAKVNDNGKIRAFIIVPYESERGEKKRINEVARTRNNYRVKKSFELYKKAIAAIENQEFEDAYPGFRRPSKEEMKILLFNPNTPKKESKEESMDTLDKIAKQVGGQVTGIFTRDEPSKDELKAKGVEKQQTKEMMPEPGKEKAKGMVVFKKVKDIIVKDRKRKTIQARVEELAKSIKELGLLQAIIIKPDNTLISGNHRLEAFKLLGIEKISCSIFTDDDLRAELAEIDENIVRQPLNTIEEGEQLKRRKEIYEILNPDSTKKAKVSKNLKQNQISENATSTDSKKAENSTSFVKDTAQKTGKSERTIQQRIKLADKLIPELKEIAKTQNTGVKILDKLSSMSEEEQKEVLKEVEKSKKLLTDIVKILLKETQGQNTIREKVKTVNSSIRKDKVKSDKKDDYEKESEIEVQIGTLPKATVEESIIIVFERKENLANRELVVEVYQPGYKGKPQEEGAAFINVNAYEYFAKGLIREGFKIRKNTVDLVSKGLSPSRRNKGKKAA